MGWETHIEKEENLRIHLDLMSKSTFFKYDFAPGSLLVSEAGGVVANIGSTSYDYTNLNFIAANPIVYKGLTEGSEALFPLI